MNNIDIYDKLLAWMIAIGKVIFQGMILTTIVLVIWIITVEIKDRSRKL